MPDADFHQEGAAEDFRGIGIVADRLFKPFCRAREIAPLLRMPPGEIFAEQMLRQDRRFVLARRFILRRRLVLRRG